MLNFDFKRTARKCSNTGRSFSSGEEYISLLLEEGEELVRKDLALDDFDSPPENCVGWWKSKVPDLQQGKVFWAPKDILLNYFNHLIENANEHHAYVMAILLLQKKFLRLRDTIEEDGKQVMHLQNTSTKEICEVTVVDVSPDRVAEIQNDLAEKLFTDVAPNQED